MSQKIKITSNDLLSVCGVSVYLVWEVNKHLFSAAEWDFTFLGKVYCNLHKHHCRSMNCMDFRLDRVCLERLRKFKRSNVPLRNSFHHVLDHSLLL